MNCLSEGAFTAANAFNDTLVHIVLTEQLLVVVIDRQNGATLSDVIIQLLHLGFHLQNARQA